MAPAASYEVLAKLGLPVFDENGFAVDTVQKNVGDTVTSDELAEAQQTDEQIADLVAGGAIKETSNA